MRNASALLLALALSGCASSAAGATASAHGAEGYALDGRDRSAPSDGKASCTPDELVTYRGTGVPYAAAVRIHPAFIPHLERFERIANDVGTEVYGRAPAKLHHGGAYACRTMPSGRYSEHAFGNALDLEGFSFPAVAKGQKPVRIHVADAWRESAGADPKAKRFFALLLQRLDDRDDVFRAIVGPPDPSHRDHLHLDMGPWSYSRYARPSG